MTIDAIVRAKKIHAVVTSKRVVAVIYRTGPSGPGATPEEIATQIVAYFDDHPIPDHTDELAALTAEVAQKVDADDPRVPPAPTGSPNGSFLRTDGVGNYVIGVGPRSVADVGFDEVGEVPRSGLVSQLKGTTADDLAAGDAPASAAAAAVALEVTNRNGAIATAVAGLEAMVDAETAARLAAIVQEVSDRNDAISEAVVALVDGAPTALDTLLELAEAIGDTEADLGAILTALDGKETPAGAQAKVDVESANRVAAISAATAARIAGDNALADALDEKVDADDPRLDDDRAPLAHASSHEPGGGDELSIGVGQLDVIGTPNAELYLRGDGSWAPVAVPPDSIWSGHWATASPYTANEAVGHTNSIYVCTANHTSGATTEPGVGEDWETYWALILSGGTGTAQSVAGVESVNTDVPRDGLVTELQGTGSDDLAAGDAPVSAAAAAVAQEATDRNGAIASAVAGLEALVDAETAARVAAILQEVSDRNDAITAAVDDLVDGAPTALNTLLELAEALGDAEDELAALLVAVDAKETPTGAQAKVDIETANRVAAVAGETAARVAAINTHDGRLDVVEADLDDKVAVDDPRLPPTPVGAPDGKIPKTLEGEWVLTDDDNDGEGDGVSDVSDLTWAGTAGGKIPQWDGTQLVPVDLPEGLDLVAKLTAEGKGFIDATADATVARPTGWASVEWLALVEPTNWVDGDTWNDPTEVP